MHLFRQVRTSTTVGGLIERLNEAAGRGDRLELLLEAARLECALADSWSPEEDDWEGGRRSLVALSRAAAAWYLNGEAGGAKPWPRLEAEVGRWLPAGKQALHTSEPEGIRYYGLAPRNYGVAARQWQACEGRRQPAWLLGLRTMGSVVAPVAAAALEAAPGCLVHRVTTLRPRGAPEDRVFWVSERLRWELRAWPGAFLIVDEGPGLSGSSFGGAVKLLTSLGVTSERIALLPSWSPDPRRLSSAYASQGWEKWKVFPAPPLTWPQSRGGLARDISAGAWRRVLGSYPTFPVWGQHERLKYLADGGQSWVKFAGLGGYGRQTRERAMRLAEAGWGPALRRPREEGQSEEGWIRYRRLNASPLGAHPGRAWAEFAGAYLAWVRAEFVLGPPQPPTPELVEMIQINLKRLLGVEMKEDPPAGVPVAVDGRMLRPEWGVTGSGFVKFDGTDHGDDPFFPGPADIAWDLAAIEVEFGHALGAAAATAYRSHSGEIGARLEPRLRWHGVGYSAFRAAYCSFAATQVGEPDRTGFLEQAARYRSACSRRVARAQAVG